jgi:hypothetical protein
MHDHATVLVMDRSIFSIGAIQSAFPVSFRNRMAFLRRRTGWYVSGTRSVIRQSWQLVSVDNAHPSPLVAHLYSRPDDD